METKPFSQTGSVVERGRSTDGFIQRPSNYTRRPYRPAHLPAVSKQAGQAKTTPVASTYDLPAYQAPYRPLKVVRTPWYRTKPALFAATLTVAFAGMLVYGRYTEGGKDHMAVRAASLPAAPTKPLSVPLPTARDIAQDMNNAMAGQTGLTAAASLIDLSTGKEYDAGNYTQQYVAASTSKLVAIFDYIHQVELGKATLAQNVYGMSAQENIRRMIVYSDNDAWARLNKYLTFTGEQRYMDSLGITATIREDNMQFTTPSMAKLLQLLYQGKLMDSGHRALVYDYMAHTTITNLIQAALPGDATVYHKYGQLYGVLHDASIVEYQGRQFVLVIYTNNPAGTTAKNAQQVALIHAVTSAAFTDITTQRH